LAGLPPNFRNLQSDNDDRDCLNIDSLDMDACQKYSKDKKEIKQPKKVLNFDELIISQDIFDGNWSINNEVKILIEDENTIYEKVKKISEEKEIKEINAIITLFVLYYIFNKKPEKVNELRFVINKAKEYIKNICGLEYEEIFKENSKI